MTDLILTRTLLVKLNQTHTSVQKIFSSLSSLYLSCQENRFRQPEFRMFYARRARTWYINLLDVDRGGLVREVSGPVNAEDSFLLAGTLNKQQTLKNQ